MGEERKKKVSVARAVPSVVRGRAKIVSHQSSQSSSVISPRMKFSFSIFLRSIFA